jgi:hypothetical protein
MLMPKRSAEAAGHYEVRPHPSLKDLVVIWWCPVDGITTPTNITLGVQRVPMLAEALADYELANTEPPPHRAQLRVVDTEPPAIPLPRNRRKEDDQ